jgi:hypothetical protein
MCGRFTQTTGDLPGLETVATGEAGVAYPPRFNGRLLKSSGSSGAIRNPANIARIA